MSVLIILTLLVLCTTNVQCAQENPVCPRKESYPGVLILSVGSEVILDCTGNLTVDGKPLLRRTRNTVRVDRKGDVPSRWKLEKARENPGTIGKRHSEIKYFATHAEVSESVTTANLPMSSVKKQVANEEVLHAIKQSTKSNSVDRDSEEGGAFGVTMEIRVSTERSTSTEYEENEDYEKKSYVKRQTQWMRNGQLIMDGVDNGRALRLPALQLTDSGNYSCYRRGELVSSVKISVGIPPESPTLSCYKKSHISKIRCEWISRQPIIPQPQCYLLLWKGLEKATRVSCSYSATNSRCWCVLASRGDDNTAFTAQMCATNVAGSATSSLYSFVPRSILKPDPPAHLAVRPVTGEPQTLKVNWSSPATWGQNLYYTLYYQLRYRPLHSKEYQQVETGELLWLISDVLPHIQYELQIRAKDYYDGQWSDWTNPVYAHAWSAPESTVVPDIYTSQETFWIYSEDSGESEDEIDVRPAAVTGVMWVYVLWVVGVCLLIKIIMVTVYFLRHRIPFMSKKNTENVSSTSSCSSPSSLLQEEGEAIGIHLHNMDYFFPSVSESYRF
ncbi:uncharacterized protein Hap1MRO34_005990 [Clarias gariepinus]